MPRFFLRCSAVFFQAVDFPDKVEIVLAHPGAENVIFTQQTGVFAVDNFILYKDFSGLSCG
jgi:hypothetical protein